MSTTELVENLEGTHSCFPAVPVLERVLGITPDQTETLRDSHVGTRKNMVPGPDTAYGMQISVILQQRLEVTNTGRAPQFYPRPIPPYLENMLLAVLMGFFGVSPWPFS